MPSVPLAWRDTELTRTERRCQRLLGDVLRIAYQFERLARPPKLRHVNGPAVVRYVTYALVVRVIFIARAIHFCGLNPIANALLRMAYEAHMNSRYILANRRSARFRAARFAEFERVDRPRLLLDIARRHPTTIGGRPVTKADIKRLEERLRPLRRR